MPSSFPGPTNLVRVDAIWAGRSWRIDVADCGIGIPPAEIGQLFDRFVRASNARTAGLPGTGLGLSVVKAIVELHGGRVMVDSTLGRGTTFSVYLRDGPMNARILVIEDDADIALGVRTVLTREWIRRRHRRRRPGGPARFPCRATGPHRPRHRAAGARRLGRPRTHPRHE